MFLIMVKYRQSVEARRHIRMLGTQSFFADCEGLLIIIFGHGIFVLQAVQHRKIVEQDGDLCVFSAEQAFGD